MVKARKSWIKMLFLSEKKVNSLTNQSINNYNTGHGDFNQFYIQTQPLHMTLVPNCH